MKEDLKFDYLLNLYNAYADVTINPAASIKQIIKAYDKLKEIIGRMHAIAPF